MTVIVDAELRLPPTLRPTPADVVSVAAVSPDFSSRPVPRPLHWWREVLVLLAFYATYTFIRGQFGSGAHNLVEAAANAQRVIDAERALGISNELALQQWFLQWPALIRGLNIFYGFFHFVVPVVVLVVLFRQAPASYRRARNALAATTGLALIGFSAFPLLPPRLLCDCPLGSGTDAGFVDTLARDGGLWSFGSHGVGAVSNQYAAMPSLHLAWALWCAIVILPLLRRRGARALAIAFPLVTLVAIIVTANHFWLDAVGGAAVLAAGFGVAALAERTGRVLTRRLSRREDRGREDSVQVFARATTEAIP